MLAGTNPFAETLWLSAGPRLLTIRGLGFRVFGSKMSVIQEPGEIVGRAEIGSIWMHACDPPLPDEAWDVSLTQMLTPHGCSLVCTF